MASAFVGMLVAAQPSYAEEKHRALTKENITEFITTTTDITTGQRLDMTPESIAKYLDRHVQKKARFKSTMKYNLPGYPPQEAALSLGKKEFMESIANGAKNVSDYHSEVQIGDIKISRDGTKATVQTSSYESGAMPVASDGASAETMPVEGNSTCTQILTLEKGVIMMFSALCETVINFESLE